ncbi:MAG TPA: Hsp20/alpha crystallin family protein [Verrucomicrobiae bacterium]|nr:Hsp20/alpha crystallin family protein [Verrucomicrobiae bacterium]
MQHIGSVLQFSKRRPAGKEHDTHWAPNTDVYLSGGSVIIKVELAGMQRENLELFVDGNKLRISGQRPDGCRPPQCKFLMMEINYGPFESAIEIPPGYDLGRAKASYQNGFLRIEVPGTGSRAITVSDE